MRKLLLPSPGGTTTADAAMPAAFSAASAGREMMARHRLVGDDRAACAPGRSAAMRSPSVREQAAADRDVVGALAERDIRP